MTNVSNIILILSGCILVRVSQESRESILGQHHQLDRLRIMADGEEKWLLFGCPGGVIWFGAHDFVF
jgi:hypothetical protein